MVSTFNRKKKIKISEAGNQKICVVLVLKVREVLWNADSTVLAVWLEDLPTDKSDAEGKQEIKSCSE